MRRQGGQHTLQTFLHLLTSWERGPLARLVLSPGRAALLPAWFFLLGARPSCPPGSFSWARGPLARLVLSPGRAALLPAWFFLLGARASCPPCLCGLEARTPRGGKPGGGKPALPGGMDSSRPAPDKALIFVRPVNHLDVPGAFFHRPSLLLGARASCPPCLCGLEARTPRGDGFITSSGAANGTRPARGSRPAPKNPFPRYQTCAGRTGQERGSERCSCRAAG